MRAYKTYQDARLAKLAKEVRTEDAPLWKDRSGSDTDGEETEDNEMGPTKCKNKDRIMDHGERRSKKPISP